MIAGAPAWNLPLEGPVQDLGSTDGRACRRLVQALIQNLARGARLQLRRGKDVLWHRDAPDTSLAVTALRVSVNGQGRLRADWDMEIGEGLETRSDMRWSQDGGKSWHVLTVGLQGRTAELELTPVPGGDTRFEILVSDGFDSAHALSAAVLVPHKPPTVAMLSPSEGARIPTGGAMRLWGAATDETGRPVPGDACQWLIDGQPVETGRDIIVAAPAAGERRVTFRATDANGTAEITHGIRFGKRTG